MLPDDDLSHDPKQPPQSLRAWMRLKDRNPVTKERNVIYVATPPEICKGMEDWDVPIGEEPASVLSPRFSSGWDSVIAQIRHFYLGLPRQELKVGLKFCEWDAEPTSPPKKRAKSKTRQPPKQEYLGLECPSIQQVVGIRHRPDPTGVFKRQLNLNDLLDAAIELLPEDAYTLLLLVPWDIYEGDGDDYCCGRAYGGSRVAVVSSARYQTSLDKRDGVDEEHAWPLSHCADYVASKAPSSRAGQKAGPAPQTQTVDETTPMGRAIIAARQGTRQDSSASNRMGDPLADDTFLLRVCRTATHELGHCFGLEHCVYYACVMQSTASMAEDVRQPPYLCPVCVGKVGRAAMVSPSQYLSRLERQQD